MSAGDMRDPGNESPGCRYAHPGYAPSLSGPHHRIDQQSRKQQKPGVAVGFEYPQAQRGIADLKA